MRITFGPGWQAGISLRRTKSVRAAVRILRFVAELGRKLRVARVNPKHIVRQDWSIAVVPDCKREGENFEQTGRVSGGGAAEPAHNAVTSGRNVAFRFADLANGVRQFGRREKEIRETAPEFARRSV